jgi:hypothetical protein
MTWTTPRTWVSGELVTSANLNTHIRDDLTDLRSSSDWLTPVLLNGWTQGFLSPVRYLRRGSWVYIKGQVTGGTFSVPCFTLIPGFRPSFTLMFSCWGQDSVSNEQQERFDINTNGDVNPVLGDNASFYLNAMFSVL